MRLRLTLPFLILVFVTACSHGKEPQFWQRTNASDLIYTQGPKAQQILSRDIAQCVNELSELERLNVLKNTLPPTNYAGRVLDPDERKLNTEAQTPTRDAFLRTELFEYHDFDSCMNFKGWERTRHVPFDIAERGRQNYLKAIGREDYQERFGKEHDANSAQTNGNSLNE